MARFGIVRPGAWLRLPREEAVERLLPDDEVADAVLAAHRQRDQLVVIAPVADASRQSQFRVEGREAAPDVALRPHVLHEGGQSGERLAVPRLSLQPASASREKVQDAMPVRVAALVHAEDGRMASEAGDLPRQSIASRHAPPEPTDARACLAHEARHHRLRDSEFPLNLLPAQKPTSPQDPRSRSTSLHRLSPNSFSNSFSGPMENCSSIFRRTRGE